ncbi:xanthine dehydrogenase family protein subunit M [Phycicoccus sp. CSK15P-2]|uniref:FAD binding domain-containing protein n=1 Tax=Phycicoccus sp. CSK15P-2 TaxID=2807627 RepID=UPI0019512F6A|nr:xanthine dehydrogenase family protein subunit M [Phycicoccus sp. CSK15P-2]MBM6404486.1 xanthine dehydrogenase family protein subunit M [Phycicoccus sp. CSK15P-2]
MRELTYVRASSAQEAVEAVTADADAMFLGGGTNLVDHLKLGVARPGRLVDVSRLPLDEVETRETPDGPVLRVGAAVRNADLAAHPLVRSGLPALSRALLAGASGQIRQQASTAGNLLQRTRCVYFQDVTTPCNKREPGSGCSALEGYDRYNAVLGASEHCVAVHPSDMAVAMVALDAVVVVLGPEGERRLPVADLHRLPGDAPQRDTTLARDELVTAVELPLTDLAARSTYRKVRDRASYAFALVSVAAALRMDGDTVADVRIVWGGAAHKPWRAELAERALVGQALDEDTVAAAVDTELATARTSEGTAYKLPMLRGTTAHTLTTLATTEDA